MSHVLMLCHDQHLDRRVVAQAQSLIRAGHAVTLLALSFDAEAHSETTPEGIRLVRIALSRIVPENPTYLAYNRRQHGLSRALTALCNRLHRFGPVFHGGFTLASRFNWTWYRAGLLARYRNRHLSDPLPFRSAFVEAGEGLRADLVQVHDLPALAAGVELARCWQVPLVYDAHELYPEQRAFSAPQRRICAQAEASLIRYADLVFAVNLSIAEEMARRYKIPTPRVLLNAIDPPPGFDPRQRRDLLREKLGLAAERRILLFQGGFAPNRNLEKLVEAMRYLTVADLDLVMMGFGDFGEGLKRQAEQLGLLGKRIHFLPAVPQSELLQHSASADLGIIPYPHVDLNSYYCTPNKLFEFIQAGLPILANDSPELNRFVRDTGFGLTAPMATAREMAAAIDRIAVSDALPQWRLRLIEECANYSWKVQEAIYLAGMRPFLEGRGARERDAVAPGASGAQVLAVAGNPQ